MECDINFSSIDDFGNVINYRIVHMFKENNKNYVIYKEEGKDDIYTDLYEIVNNSIKIIPITNEEDYDIVDRYLERL